jgi:soluble lytic murein transglycosylase-like protein
LFAVQAAGLLALVALPAARGAERISLANGFDLICDHHVVVDGRIRVYPKAKAPDYFELNAESVSGVEVVPDPVPETLTAAPAETNTQIATELRVETKAAQLSAVELHQLLSKAGSAHNVDEDLLASVVKAESNGWVRAKSRCGAQGLMQLMPGTAKELGVTNSFVPEQNVSGGTAYLDWLLTRYHDDIALAVAAYNAGPAAVDKYHGIPPYRETRAYVARVVREFNRRVAERQRVSRTLSANSIAPGSIPSGSDSRKTGSE